MVKLPKFAYALFALQLLVCGIAEAIPQPSADLSAQSSYLTGQFLVAGQQMADQRFAKTVIYMIAYSKEGAMGVIVNRVFGTISFRKLLAPLGIKTRVKKKINVYLGGPVETDRGLILHSPEYMGASARPAGHGIALSTGTDVLQALAEGKGPKLSRLMLGYAGWGAGQLDHELARGDWLVAPADASLIFSTDPEQIWSKALLHAGISL
jgi:putative transcriptional regulator